MRRIGDNGGPALDKAANKWGMAELIVGGVVVAAAIVTVVVINQSGEMSEVETTDPGSTKGWSARDWYNFEKTNLEKLDADEVEYYLKGRINEVEENIKEIERQIAVESDLRQRVFLRGELRDAMEELRGLNRLLQEK